MRSRVCWVAKVTWQHFQKEYPRMDFCLRKNQQSSHSNGTDRVFVVVVVVAFQLWPHSRNWFESRPQQQTTKAMKWTIYTYWAYGNVTLRIHEKELHFNWNGVCGRKLLSTEMKWVMLLWIGLTLWIIWCFCKVLILFHFFHFCEVLNHWTVKREQMRRQISHNINTIFMLWLDTGKKERKHPKRYIRFLYCLLFDRFVGVESVLWDIK